METGNLQTRQVLLGLVRTTHLEGITGNQDMHPLDWIHIRVQLQKTVVKH